MNNKKVVSAVIISIILIVLVLLSIRQHKSQKSVLTPEITLVYAENQVEDYPTTKGAYEFARLVNEKLMDELRLLLNVMENLGMKSLLLNSLSLVELTFQEFP